MTGTKGTDIKGKDLWQAFVDLVILALLVTGAGFGGYWYGVHERLAPITNVAPGTPGALPATAVTPAAATPTTAPATTTATATSTSAPATAAPAPAAAKGQKFWIASSGTDFIGYNIVVKVNDKAVDSFFIQGKSIDITRFVNHGDNSITFEAKQMGGGYNKHKGDAKSELKLQVVHGPTMTESYKPADVLVSYKRNAAEDEDFNDTFHFQDGD